MENEDLIPQEILDNWADCLIIGCSNKCCLRLNSKYCFPHTMSDKSLDEVIAEIEQYNSVANVSITA